MRALINSVPKSGTNMLHKALELLGYRYAQLGIADTLLSGRFQLVRKLIRNNPLDRTKIDIGMYRQTCIGKKWIESKLGGLNDGEFITGHAGYSSEFADLLEAKHVVPILVVRDPRDVLLSHLDYFPRRRDIFLGRALTGYPQFDLNIVLNGLRDDREIIHSFRRAYERFLPWSERFPNNVFRFEDLVGPNGGGTYEGQWSQIERIAKLLGDSVTEQDIESVASRLFGGTPTFSKGQANKWKGDSLFRENEANFRRSMGDVLAALGYQ
ncbi:sulfotransferase family protein [Lentisalinibacter sediminis]|uniref:hypothetical protein n=1 Tax=Lentisalinibacter sediminis TaxID=2992237 RepID=UPI003867FBF4